MQAVFLQMAAAQEWGPDGFDKLDRLTVSLGHPDAHTALMSGQSQITAHFSNTPFQEQALENPKVSRVLSSFEVMGGPATNGVIASTNSFRNDNPLIYKAFIGALDEANKMIDDDIKKAAEVYITESKSKLSLDQVVKILSSEDVVFTAVPLNTEKYAKFMFERGTIKNNPESWKDLFFPEIHGREGS